MEDNYSIDEILSAVIDLENIKKDIILKTNWCLAATRRLVFAQQKCRCHFAVAAPL